EFGEDDSRVGKLYNLPFVQLIDERGKFIEGCEELTGLFCKDADKVVLKKLKADGTLFAELAYEHSYPFCWRCDTPLIYYARKSWFIKMTAVKNDLVANNKKINWIPESIGSGRMGNFLENVIDWGISRDRYWGTPLPIWVCPDCGEVKVIGSRAELSKLSGCPEDIELHRPMLDDVTISCSKCGGVMRRTPEVIDCWFDSGSMPYAQFHYPFENKDLFEKNFPADFISEAVDQTRGWFYTLSAISTLLFNKPAFKNCIVLGLVGDEFGVKMSKHKGNGFDPWKAFNKQGADAVRWYFYTSSAPWLPSRFYDEAVSEVQRRFLGTLWNTYAFFVLYAEIDKFNPSKHTLKDCKLSEMDRWVLSELNTLIIDTDKHLTNYEVTEAARGLESFVDNLSNWYVRRCRERYWGSEWTEDKQAAYVTLYTVLLTFAKLCAPFVPFISEEIYQNLVPQFYPNEPKSVHLCSYPVADKSYIDNGLNVGMEEVLKIVVLGRSARNSANIKNRQPLARMFVFSPKLTKLPENLQKIVLGELNIKELSYTADLNRFITYSLKPQLRTLGPKYGKHLNAIREHLFALGDKTVELVNTLRKGEKYHIVLDNEAVELSEEDLLITSESTRGYQSVTDNGITVVLDTTLTPELVEEGIERELISKIQTLRKDNGFNVVDHIIIQIETDIDTLGVVTKYSDDIRKDTLSDRIDIVTGGLPTEPIDINGHSVKLILSVVK
ncbi:MAG: class I tRNA ligase family protein, partial [Clostridia bacterium]